MRIKNDTAMTVKEVMQELEQYGNAGTKKVLVNHGAREPFFGVKVGDMKVLQKKIKKDYELSLGLYDTGNSDAMYFAGLIADEKKMTKADLNKWAKAAYWHMLSEYTVAWIAAESNYGMELALEWIESDKEQIAIAGWSTLSNLAMIKEDAELDVKLYEKLINRVVKEIHKAPNYVRYTMNSFIIATGSGIAALSNKAKAAATKIGEVQVDMGGTACKVPDAVGYINKVESAGRLGKKKKMARC